MARKKPLERTIELYVVNKAREMGMVARKMNGMGFNDWPDRVFMMKGGHVFFIEFKRPGNKLTEKQAAMKIMLDSLGFTVYVVDTKEEGIRIIHGEWKAHQ